MLNGYNENILSPELSHNLETDSDSFALNHQLKTYKLIRKSSDFAHSTQIKRKLLNDFDPTQFREFNDPLDDIEKKYMLLSSHINEKKAEFKDFFDTFQKVAQSTPVKNFSFDYKEDIKQKFIFNFVTNDVGKPNCFQVSHKLLVVGTKFGFIFCYNLKDSSHTICPPISRDKRLPIICLDVSHDEELIVCGYLNGSIALYDVASYRLIKCFQAIHSGSSSVLALKFYHNTTKSSSKSKIISSDSEGKVYKTFFEKNFLNIWNTETFPIIEKNAGNIKTIKILKSVILNSSESTKNVTIAALASNIKVCVIQIEPKNSVIYVVPRPSFVKDIYYPSVSWDEGLYKYHEEAAININSQAQNPKHSEKSIFLMICWDKYIDLLSFKENYDEEQDCFSLTAHVIGSLILNTPSIYTSFISVNLIVGITESYQVFFLNLDDIQESKEGIMKNTNNNVNSVNNFEFPREKFEIEIRPVLQISDKMMKLDSRNDNAPEFLLINSKKEEHSLIFIEKKEKDESFGIFEVFSWPNFINYLMKTDKKMAFYKMLEIYEHGSTDFIALIPKVSKIRKKSMKDFIKQLMKNFLFFHFEKKSEKVEIEEESNSIMNIGDINDATKIIIDFVVRIEEFDFFFQEIVKIFKDHAVLNILFLCLEIYIEMEKFRIIPEEVLIQMISFYKQEGKLDLIQKLILSLDLNKVDNFQIIAICMEFQLFRPLIYICTIYNNDFLTPLVKIASHYLSLKNGLNEASNTKQIGLLFLWYIKLCISGKTIIGSNIEIKIYELVIQQLVLWIFVRDNLAIMLELDPKFTFDICYLFFHGVASKIIRSFHSYMKINSKEIENSENIHPTRVPQMKMLSLLLSTEEELFKNETENIYPKEERVWMFVFIVRILDLEEYDIDPQKCYEGCIYMLRNQEILDILFKNESQTSSYVHIEKNKFIIKLIRSCKSTLSSAQIDKLLSYSLEMDQVHMYLLMLKKEFSESVSVCLNSKNEILRNLTFEWIKEVILEIKSEDNSSFYLKHFNSFLLENLKSLLILNSEEANCIIRNNLQNYDPFLLVESLKEDFNMQLNFIENLFISKSYKSFSDKFLVYHLDLVCKLRPNEVLNNLKSRDYPLDSSIEICKMYDLKEPQAFLYLRSGAIDKVLGIYLEMFCNNLKEIKENPETDPKDLMRISKEIIEVSQNNSFCDLDGKENLWFENFAKLTEFVKEIFGKEEICSAIKEILKEIFSQMIYEMWKNMPHKLFIDKIQKYNIDLDLGILRSSFLALIENSQYEKKILRISKNLFQCNNYEKILLLQNKIKNGQCFLICNACQKKFEEREFAYLVIFCCEHAFHDSCYSKFSKKDDGKCPKCHTEKSKLEKVIFQNKMKKPKETHPFIFNQAQSKKNEENGELKKREKQLNNLEKFDDFQNLLIKKAEEFTRVYDFDM